MKKKSFLNPIFVVLLFSVLILGIVSCNDENVRIDEDEVGHWQASRPVDYMTFDELFTDRDMDLIATGVIDRVIQVTEIEGSERAVRYRTAFAFRIETLFMGEDAKEVVVYQLGSPDNPGSGLDDDPVFKVGEKHVLFLKKNIHDSYYTIGAGGRYKVVADKVYSLNYVLPDNRNYKAPESMDFNGNDLKYFTELIIEKLKVNTPLPESVASNAIETTS